MIFKVRIEKSMPKGGGGKGGGGSQPAPEPEIDTQARNEREASQVEEIRAQMAESQTQLQDALKEQQANFAKAQKDAEEKAAQYRRDQERVSAYDEIDYLTMGRLEAEETAISSVEDELAQEEANVRVRGADWGVTEEQKEARIQKRFEEFWGKDSESRLGDLMRSWGSPEQEEKVRKAVEEGASPWAWEPGRKIEGFDYSQYVVSPDPESKTPAKSPAKTPGKPKAKAPAKTPPKTPARKSKEKPKFKLPPGLLPGVAPTDLGGVSSDSGVSLLGGTGIGSLLGR